MKYFEMVRLTRSRVAGVVTSLGLAVSTAAAPAPAFELERFGGGDPVKLADFAGEILVIDFFAYWCAPCARSAPVIEEEIAKYYTTAGGNPQGIAVRLLSVNVEAEQREKTAQFVRRHGLSRVVHDQAGETLGRYGGKGLPYLVIVDGTRGTRDEPRFEVVYRHAGFEGIRKLRTLIDGLGRKTP
jgi:thiol-disulfide isomerase/thioredoxin